MVSKTKQYSIVKPSDDTFNQMGWGFYPPAIGYRFLIYNNDLLDTVHQRDLHYFQTSPVVGVKRLDKSWEVKTQNSLYIVKEIKNDSEEI